MSGGTLAPRPPRREKAPGVRHRPPRRGISGGRRPRSARPRPRPRAISNPTTTRRTTTIADRERVRRSSTGGPAPPLTSSRRCRATREPSSRGKSPLVGAPGPYPPARSRPRTPHPAAAAAEEPSDGTVRRSSTRTPGRAQPRRTGGSTQTSVKTREKETTTTTTDARDEVTDEVTDESRAPRASPSARRRAKRRGAFRDARGARTRTRARAPRAWERRSPPPTGE